MSLLVLLAAARAQAAPLDRVSVGGFFDFELERTLRGAGGDRNGSFDLHHLNVVTSYQVDDRLDVRMQVEWEHSFQSGGGGQLTLEYGFAEYRVLPWLRLRVGRALSPYGFYNELHDSSPAWNTYAIPAVIYHPYEWGGIEVIPKQYTGVSALGDLPLGRSGSVHYDLWLSNGVNVVAWDGERDDNPGKGVGGNLVVRPDTSWAALVSAYYESRPVLLDDGEISDAPEPHFAWVGGLSHQGTVGVEVEVARAWRGSGVRQWSAQATLSLEVTPWLVPYVRGGIARGTDVRHELLETGVALRQSAAVVLKAENAHHFASPTAAAYDELRASVAVAF